MNKPRVVDKLKKIRELALRGTTHEAKIARAKLNNLLAEHGLTEADLISEEKKVYWFSYGTKEEQKIIFGIYAFLMSADSVRYAKGKRRVGFQLTAAEYIRFKEYIDVFLPAFRKEMAAVRKNFVIAFICKNNLENNAPQTGEADKGKCSLSRSDIEKILGMMKTMDDINRPDTKIEYRACG